MKISDLLLLYKPSVSGASHAFSKFDLIRMVYLLRAKDKVSRKEISEKLEIGEGSTRTLLGTLRKAGFVQVTIFGCELSKSGLREVNEIFENFEPIGQLDASELTFSKPAYCIIARSAVNKIASGVTQRDAALLAGASGATILIYSNTGFNFPQVSKNTRVDYFLTITLRARSEFEEGDVVILSFAEGPRERERGAWAAVSTL